MLEKWNYFPAKKLEEKRKQNFHLATLQQTLVWQRRNNSLRKWNEYLWNRVTSHYANCDVTWVFFMLIERFSLAKEWMKRNCGEEVLNLVLYLNVTFQHFPISCWRFIILFFKFIAKYLLSTENCSELLIKRLKAK